MRRAVRAAAETFTARPTRASHTAWRPIFGTMPDASACAVRCAGDNRLLGRLRRPELKPIASRIRQRLVMTPAEPAELARLLDHLLEEAGNPALMTAGLKDTLVAHAGGNPRTLTVMADTLLAAGCEQDREQLDEKLFLETLGEPAKPGRARR